MYKPPSLSLAFVSFVFLPTSGAFPSFGSSIHTGVYTIYWTGHALSIHKFFFVDPPSELQCLGLSLIFSDGPRHRHIAPLLLRKSSDPA